MKLYYNQVNPEQEPSTYTHYLYDAGGNRVKKLTRTQGGNWECITYIDGLIEYREDHNGQQQSISHIMDDSKRIASFRNGFDFGDSTPAIKYNMDDHLGSSNLSVDENGTLVNREEYYPFGETSFGSYSKKRYRFCGKEKDEESGLYYYGARYYSPWTCRFISVDPLAEKYPFYTAYQYAGNKPINFIDLDEMEEAQPQTLSAGSGTVTPQVDNAKPNSGTLNNQNRIPTWEDLAKFEPGQTTLDSLKQRNEEDKSIMNGYQSWKIQDIKDAKGTNVNLDFYSITVDKLPTLNNKQLTAEDMLQYIRINIADFKDKNIANARPYSAEDAAKWCSDDPLNTAITFDIGGEGLFKNIDDAGVMMTYNSSNGWVFSTIQNPNDFQHPVSGNRYFGFVKNSNGSYTFFTKGIDRLTGILDEKLGGTEAFVQADKLWQSFQSKVAEFVNNNGGKASINKPYSVRFRWDIIKSIFKM